MDKPPSRAVRYVRMILPLLWLLSACPQLPPATKATAQVERRNDKHLLEQFIRRLIYQTWPEDLELATSKTLYLAQKDDGHYHRENCPLVGESRRAITPEYAKSHGYKPCEECKPLQ